MQVSRTPLVAVSIAFVALGLYAGVNLLCQHRAEFPGGVTFIGESRNVFSATYWRVYMWRASNTAGPLPDVTVSIDGRQYALSALTTDIVTKLGGTLMTGDLTDAQGNVLRYRFENGKLTWFSFDAENRRRNAAPPKAHQAQTITIALGDGPQFGLPISHGEMVRCCGKPERTYLNFAQ